MLPILCSFHLIFPHNYPLKRIIELPATHPCGQTVSNPNLPAGYLKDIAMWFFNQTQPFHLFFSKLNVSLAFRLNVHCMKL